MNTNIPVQYTSINKRHPNDSETLKEVLGAIAHMMEQDQVAKNTPALVNILCALEGYDSDDMATFRQTLLSQFNVKESPVLQPAECTPYELWEEEYKDGLGKPLGFKPPFANDVDRVFGVPVVNEEEDKLEEYMLSDSQVKLICKALDALIEAKAESITDDEASEIDLLCQSLA